MLPLPENPEHPLPVTNSDGEWELKFRAVRSCPDRK